LTPSGIAGFAKCPDAKPDQIERSGEFERGKQLRTGKDEGGDAERAGDHMDQPAERRPERRGDAGFPAA
jgi:hypothetical protein